MIIDCEGIFLEFDRSAIRTVKPGTVASVETQIEPADVEDATSIKTKPKNKHKRTVAFSEAMVHFYSRTVSKIKQAPQQNRDRSFCCGAVAFVTRWESVSLTLVCLGLLATSISKFLQRKRLLFHPL